ncbi:MAG: TetR/AcrR family transcriptional regulator [Anaerolineaceae bacterium]|nr:TetR/AcrR family transcriptional regulator [Anaerolineaceae bacterium]
MVRPKRNQQHPNLPGAIKDVARKQISEHGTASLSLRAVARELGITAPAIYNYFPRRDDLVTALIVDAYHSLAKSLTETQHNLKGDHAWRIKASARAYRNWALAHAAEYSLIFGTPIPGYHASMAVTGPAAAESMLALIQVLDAAYQDGVLSVGELSPALIAMLQSWVEQMDYSGPPAVIHLALAFWAQLHGLVSLELFGHLGADTECDEDNDASALFEAEIQYMTARMGLN